MFAIYFKFPCVVKKTRSQFCEQLYVGQRGATWGNLAKKKAKTDIDVTTNKQINKGEKKEHQNK